VVEVTRHGAFSVNAVGLCREPFPLTFSVSESAGCWVVSAAAAQASELADIFAQAAKDTILVMNIETPTFVDEQHVQWSPARIAAAQGVNYSAHALDSLATGVAGLSREALVMPRTDLRGFLAGWSLYELTLIGVPARPNAERLDGIALAIATSGPDEPVLPNLPGCCLWYSGHDDCYIWVESVDPGVPPAILGRLLSLLAGSALAGDEPVEVADPDRDFADALIGTSQHWIGTLDAASATSVTVGLSSSNVPWRFGQPMPAHADRLATYDVVEATWSLTPRSNKA
jgi:hypothetical protein